MSLLKKLGLILIAVSLVSLATLPSTGFCDDWEKLDRNKEFTQYYNASSVNIDSKEQFIKVWVKQKYTEAGKAEALKEFDNKDKAKNLDHKLIMFEIDYKDAKYAIKKIMYYDNSGDVINELSIPEEWTDIVPGSMMADLMDRILKKAIIKN